jgi:AcrR family transcriptional regulator
MVEHSRKARTKEALLSAFRDLFYERGYEAIRVGDIIARAGVGRSTFYEHYRSKQALYAQSLERTASRLAIIVDTSTEADDLIPLFEHFWENRGKSRRLHGTTARRQLVRMLAGLLERQLIESTARGSDPGSRAVAAFALAEMLVGSITAWQAGEIGRDPSQFARELNAVVAAVVAALPALNRAQGARSRLSTATR